MRIYRYLLVLAICSNSVGLAVAGVVERDLLEAGDGLLTYDDVNHREWLDMPETNQMPLEEVLLNLAPGGPWEGFQFATREDVRQLADSLQAPWQTEWTLPFPVFEDGSNLLDLLGRTIILHSNVLGRLDLSGGFVSTLDATDTEKFDGSTVMIGFFPREVIPGALNRSPRRESLTFIESHSPVAFQDGTVISEYWLFREAVVVPEPTSLCLMFTGSLIALRLRAFA